MPLSLTELTPGHDFPPTTFTITPEMARAYRLATADTQEAVYESAGNGVPPLAVAALALGALLEQVELPPGSLHASESVEFQAVVPEGAALQCRARLVQRSVRAGWVVSVLETAISHEGGNLAVSARATVLSPAEA